MSLTADRKKGKNVRDDWDDHRQSSLPHMADLKITQCGKTGWPPVARKKSQPEVEILYANRTDASFEVF